MAPRKGSGVEPCTDDTCRFPTRPNRRTIAEMPATRARRVGGLCAPCYEMSDKPESSAPDRPPRNPIGDPDPHVVAGLNRLMEARRAREKALARRLYPGMATPRTATA